MTENQLPVLYDQLKVLNHYLRYYLLVLRKQQGCNMTVAEQVIMSYFTAAAAFVCLSLQQVQLYCCRDSWILNCSVQYVSR